MSNKQELNIFVAMSGGVDSSVAALLLTKLGYNCTGVYMKNWSGEDMGIKGDCPWKEDQAMAEAVCKKINIPFMSSNFEKEYRKKVIEYFFSEYKAGRTPNPDVLCNKEIKFGLFLDRALEEGADLIATGHYARISRNSHGQLELLKGIDKAKDQSYFLYTLTQTQLCRTTFPIGEYTKPQVRKIAAENKLPSAKRPDSQGICFVGEINIHDFIKSKLGTKKGDIVTADGIKIGEHEGIWFYTIGQRKGIGIGGGKPYYVTGIDVSKNQITVSLNPNDPLLYKKSIQIEKPHWISGVEPKLPLECEVSIRYNHNPQAAILSKKDRLYNVIFRKPQRAPTAGQSAVIYKDEVCLGGGMIK